MPDHSIIVYFNIKPLKPWFYIHATLLALFFFGIVFLAIDNWISNTQTSYWLLIVQFIIAINSLDRLIKEYKDSKGNKFYIQIDKVGVSWRLPSSSLLGTEVIIWSDIRNIKVDTNLITIAYMSTYFKNFIPLDRLNEMDKANLKEVLKQYATELKILHVP